MPAWWTTVRVFSTITSHAEALEAREDVGRPLGLPLRPLGNQPVFALRFDWRSRPATRQPVYLVDDDDVDLAGADVVQQLLKVGSVDPPE